MSRSFASLIFAAKKFDPPWSGCTPIISLRCAARISSSVAPGFKVLGTSPNAPIAMIGDDARKFVPEGTFTPGFGGKLMSSGDTLYVMPRGAMKVGREYMIA